MAFAAFRNRLIPLAALAACASLCAVAATAESATPPKHAALDLSRIHSYYTDGEFDKVIKDLESFLKSRRACSHAESVFIEKHLSVVYAAHPGTRELGRYHMFRLLDLAPGSDLLDMFVGDEVGGVFDKVGKEYALRNPSKVPAQQSAASNPASAKAAPASGVKAPASADSRIAAMVNARPLPVPETRTAPSRAAAPGRPASPAYAASSANPAVQSNPSARSAAASPSPAPASRSPVAYRLPSAKASPSAGNRTAFRDSAAALRKAAGGEPSRPAWKEPGLWIGGGAAFAVVAFTIFYSGADDAPAGKTYVVPSTAAR